MSTAQHDVLDRIERELDRHSGHVPGMVCVECGNDRPWKSVLRDVLDQERRSILARASTPLPVYCTGGCDACRDAAREMGVPMIVPPPPGAEPSPSLDIATLADVLTEYHLRRDGICGESHREDAKWLAGRYVVRIDHHPGPSVEYVTPKANRERGR